jgi:hypothetical protein
MKKVQATLLALIPAILLSAQSYEGKIEYLKKENKAMIIEFPYEPSEVEDAIVAKMEKMGYKKKESKGFLVYKNAVIKEISSEPADYVIKVERKSRKEKDESLVYFIMNKGEENVITRSDAFLNSTLKTFLNGLSPQVESHHLENEIRSQEAALAKAEKKFKDLQDDQQTMEKKAKKLQEDLEDNVKNQENQQKEIENQKQILEAMKGKRKS